MVRNVDIFIINGDSFINYCSGNDVSDFMSCHQIAHIS